MVQASSTSYTDQARLPGATAVRVIGVLLILQGSLRLIVVISGVVQAFGRAIDVDYVAANVILVVVLALLTVTAGVLLFRRERSARLFALVVCPIALAYQLFAFGSALIYLYALAPSLGVSLGIAFWGMNVSAIVLFL